MPTRKLQVEIVGDASSLHKALGQAGKSSSTLGSRLKTLGKYAVVAGGAAGLGGLFVTLRQGFSELSESQQVMGQTAAALKSTGGAANVTARQVENLATAQSKLTGIDDEAVQAGENMLLTFTNIRNEIGRGNDIFNQSTVAVENMATAMNRGAIPSAEQLSQTAIRVGKALNDPVKGMTALQRVGVAFTKSQADQIKAMVASGDTMGAQKLILAELTKEFGGSAKAAGETFPGQLAKLKNSFDEAAGALVTQLLPYLTRFVEFINQNMPTIQAVMDATVTVIVTSFQLVAKAVDAVIGPAKAMVEFFKGTSTEAQIAAPLIAAFGAAILTTAVAIETISAATKAWTFAQAALNVVMAANPFVLIAAAIVALGAALVVAYMRSETFRNAVNKAFEDVKAVVLPIVEELRQAWARWGDEIVTIARAAFSVLKAVILTPLQNIFSAMQVIIDIFHGDWQKAWDDFKEIPIRTLNAAVTVIRGLATIFGTAALALGKAILDGIVEGLKGLPGALVAALGAIHSAISTVASSAAGWAYEIGVQVVQGVLNGLGGLWNAVKGKIESILHGVLGSLNPFSPVEHGGELYIGAPIMQGAIQGVVGAAPALLSAFQQVLAQQVMAVQSSLPPLLAAFRVVYTKVLEYLESLQPAFYQRGKDLGDGLANGLLDARGHVVDAANALAAAVTQALGVADMAAQTAQTGALNATGGQRTRIGGMQHGGIVTQPTLTWIGERGPEAVIPLNQMGAAGNTYIFEFPNYVGDRNDLISEVRRGLYEVSRRNPGAIPGTA